MSRVEQMHSLETDNARAWSQMLASPQDHLVRAPSSTPFLASKARFVKSIDIPYSVASQGRFTVVALPNALLSLAISGNNTAIPSSGTAPLSLVNPNYYFRAPQDTSYVTEGLVLVLDAAGNVLGSTSFGDLGSVSGAFNGIIGVRVTVPANETITLNIQPLGSFARSVKWRVRWCYQNPGGFGTTDTPSQSGSSLSFTTTLPAGSSLVGYAIQNVSVNGNPTINSRSYSMQVEGNASQASVPTSAGTLNLGITSTELVEAGKVGLQRCTAISLLVTNLAPPIQSGGEIVMARTSSDILATSQGNASLASAIKQLPEQLYWRSGSIQEGGYAWWLPDDLESYEPRELGSADSEDNVLIATGQMTEGGLLRVICTWTFEFYTPVQLFQRGYNCAYSQSHKDMWLTLTRQPACSGNPGHIALLKGIAATLTSVYAFYQAHKSLIDPAAKQALKMVSKQMRKTSGAQGGTKANQVKVQKDKATQPGPQPPPLPPRPKRK